SSKPENIKLIVPVNNGVNQFTLLLYKVNISPNGLNLITSDGLARATDNSIVHYRGVIENDDQSIVAVSFSSNEVMGMISNANGNYVLGKIENNSENLYMIYNDKDLIPRNNFDCATNDVPQGYVQKNSPPGTLSVNCVNWYWETDYDIYLGKGSSVSNVNSYIQGIFNQVSTLYDNDGMNITLLTVFIWSTVDPYTGPSTSNYLSQFGSYRTSFNGDLANLLGYAGGGGVAWVDGFCASTSHKMGYCGISSSFNNVPTYSWTVEVVAHEEGHLFGSSHTHSCVWNGNNTKIDACGDDAGYPSGSCAWTVPALPPGGGTIMSYCHLTSVGINFNLGFGPQPQALMLNNQETSSCLSACSGCNPPSQPGTISGGTALCQSAVQTYSITAVSGATSYTWTLPSGWTGSSTSTSIVATASSAGGSVTVKANNACGSSAVRTLSVTVTPVPAQPGTISGGTTICQSAVQTYSISSVSGATSYTWTLPSGWTGSSTSTSIVATAGSTGGNITVKANNSCGSSTVRTLAVTVTAIPGQPGTISGNASVCQSASNTYSVSAVAGATSYTWTLPSGWTGSSSNNSITATAGSAGGNITVKANNSCGSSAVRTLAVTVNTVPASPGTIDRSGGRDKVCPGDSRIYSVVSVPGLTYNWTVPTGASITSGQGTNVIHVTYNSNFTIMGTLSVTASNSCGAGPVSSTVIKRKIPSVPASISGPVSVCNGSVTTYSIAAVPSALYYIWTIPSGASIQGSQTGTSITVQWGANSGNITVKAHNNCADSGPQTLAVNVTCRQAGENNPGELNAEAFPNPSTGNITVKFSSDNEMPYTLSIQDATGRILKSEKQKSIIGENLKTFDLSSFNKGIYFIRIENMYLNQLLKISLQ
ncbi:MAG TPA: M12 family metallo-peptidase, partial [Bacteroidia bacterium]|nr:M12 family metallo-peptidase [Bacteroidia bacterium]